MDSDSDISFNYEDGDDDVYFSEGEVLASDTPFENDEKKSTGNLNIQNLHSPNLLSDFWFRSLRIEWYVNEHFVENAKRAQDILPGFTLGELLVMLQVKKWLVSEVTGDYYVNWPKLRDACGLTDTRGEVHDISAVENFTCDICCESGTMATFLLSCNHRYCADCYARYVQMNLPKGELIRCMNLNCSLSLLPEAVEKLVAHKAEMDAQLALEEKQEEEEENDDLSSSSDEEMDDYDRQFTDVDLSLRRELLESGDKIVTNKALVSAARVNIDMHHSRYRWCPAPDCTNLAELVEDPRTECYDRTTSCDLRMVPIVTCPDSHEFCFDCLYENHLPCPCWLVEAWVKKCADDSETANWIEANTQSCPKCLSQIEKNGGCNHMTCRKCRYEFCWICLGDWDLHNSMNWKCNRYITKEVEQVRKRKSEKQESLNRYLHFYKRFSVHQRSMSGDQETLASVHHFMLMYMKEQRFSAKKMASWNDVQFLSDAIRSLTSGRKTLMWTYAFAFFLKRSNLSVIFEGMQDYLNKTVEDLSQLFEDINAVSKKKGDAVGKIIRSKTEIMNLAALVTRRKQLLIECAHSELQLGFLQFFN